MDKNEVLKVGREYTDLEKFIQGELAKIDRELPDDVKKKREAVIRDKYQEAQDARLDKIRQGREYFEAARKREADPMKALIKKAWRADDTRPGMAAITAAMETMSAEAQLELAREFNHPVLALQAVANVKKMEMDPMDRLGLIRLVDDLTSGYIDTEKIRDYAQTELACVQVEADINQNSGGDAIERLGFGHKIDALKKIIATGQLPKSERISALSHPDPLERMRAARKDDGDAEAA